MTEKKANHAPIDRERARPAIIITTVTVKKSISFGEKFFLNKIKAIENGRNKFIYPPYIL